MVNPIIYLFIYFFGLGCELLNLTGEFECANEIHINL